MRAAPLAALALGCGAPLQADTGPSGDDYRGPPGARIELVPADAPEATPWMLAIEEASWELRVGDRWRNAETAGQWTASREDGLWVDASHLLPADPSVGSAAEGVTVVSEGEHAVWYGTFPWTVSVEVEAGPFAGPAVFALDVGPIVLTVEGETRELAGYE